ncbi:uncharacterized protein [Trachinotus anak]|uniref:uncharacterized protein isoform X3 n=1 Tax=Trachinotus anak TaxID=443729 RepID=UPI0039F2330C
MNFFPTVNTWKAPAQLHLTAHQVLMDVTRPQVCCLVPHKATSGTDRVSHNLLSPGSVKTADLLLDLPLQQEPMHLCHIHTKLEAQGLAVSSKTGQSSYPVKQQDSRENKCQALSSSDIAQTKPTTHTGLSQKGQHLGCRPPNPTHQYPQQCRPLPPPVPPTNTPSARAVQPQNNSWKFTDSFGPQRSPFEGKRNSNQPQTARPTQSQQQIFPMKPAPENSLRILTAVIDGMRHWSQFKDKVPYLFEIFATLDSAVTVGHHGAKTFLMRDGKEAVQCVFYENEQELPRLIRGQIHRCVGNYDRGRDVLMCVSVRPGLPSELRNAHEAVKACDAEMRVLVKSLSEV